MSSCTARHTECRGPRSLNMCGRNFQFEVAHWIRIRVTQCNRNSRRCCSRHSCHRRHCTCPRAGWVSILLESRRKQCNHLAQGRTTCCRTDHRGRGTGQSSTRHIQCRDRNCIRTVCPSNGRCSCTLHGCRNCRWLRNPRRHKDLSSSGVDQHVAIGMATEAVSPPGSPPGSTDSPLGRSYGSALGPWYGSMAGS